MSWRSCRCAVDQSGRRYLNTQFLTSDALVFLVIVGPGLGAPAPTFQNDDFSIMTMKTATLWSNLPLYAAGDDAPYQATTARNRACGAFAMGVIVGCFSEMAGKASTHQPLPC